LVAKEAVKPMTLASAAHSPHISVQHEGGEYQPGVCNIGPAEIAKRRRSGHVGVILTIALFAILVALGVPHWMRFVVALPAAVAASGYLQAYMKFCVGFATLHVFNFDDLGPTTKIANPEFRAKDRARATQMLIVTLTIGVLVGLIAVFLPL
jgi:hypothetical protein